MPSAVVLAVMLTRLVSQLPDRAKSVNGRGSCVTSLTDTPKIGSFVTVTTRYRESYYLADNEWRITTYCGEVLPPEGWFTPSQFKIATAAPNLPFRVLDLKYVVTIDGAPVEHTASAPTINHVHITGSKGDSYTVTIKDGTPISCTCPAFTFRKRCRHLSEASASVDS